MAKEKELSPEERQRLLHRDGDIRNERHTIFSGTRGRHRVPVEIPPAKLVDGPRNGQAFFAHQEVTSVSFPDGSTYNRSGPDTFTHDPAAVDRRLAGIDAQIAELQANRAKLAGG